MENLICSPMDPTVLWSDDAQARKYRNHKGRPERMLPFPRKRSSICHSNNQKWLILDKKQNNIERRISCIHQDPNSARKQSISALYCSKSPNWPFCHRREFQSYENSQENASTAPGVHLRVIFIKKLKNTNTQWNQRVCADITNDDVNTINTPKSYS